jgi:hypothetical protein
VVVRYANDLVVGFQFRADAVRFLDQLRQRLQKFGLELHPQKTRIIEFGRFAARNRKEQGGGKPETFASSASRIFAEPTSEEAISSRGTPFGNGCGRSFGRSKRR